MPQPEEPVGHADSARTEETPAPGTGRRRFVLVVLSTAVAAWALVGSLLILSMANGLKGDSDAAGSQAFTDFVRFFGGYRAAPPPMPR